MTFFRNITILPVFVLNGLAVFEPRQLRRRIADFRYAAQVHVLSFNQMLAFRVPFDVWDSRRI